MNKTVSLRTTVCLVLIGILVSSGIGYYAYSTVFVGDQAASGYRLKPMQESTYVIRQLNSTFYCAQNFTQYGTDANAGYEFLSTNASDVINNAITHLTTGRTWKERVTLKGQFPLTAGITLSSFTVLNLNDAYLLRSADSNFSLVQASNANNIEIVGGTIDGNDAAVTYKGVTENTQMNIYFLNVSYSLVENVNVVNSTQNGINVIDNCYNNRFVGNYFFQDRRAGILLYYTLAGVGPHDNYIGQNKVRFTGSNRFGIYLSGPDTKRNTVEGNTCQDNNDTNNGIRLDAAIENTIISNTFTNNTVGIDLTNAANRNTISGNVVSNSTNEGIYVVGGNNTVITSNIVSQNGHDGIRTAGHFTTISNNQIYKNGYDGIRLGASNCSIVTSNSVLDNSQATAGGYVGVEVAAAFNCTISYNTIIDTQATKTQQKGVLENVGSDFNTITNNNVFKNRASPYMTIIGVHDVVLNNPGFDLILNETTITMVSGTSTYIAQTTSGSIISQSTDFATVLNTTVSNAPGYVKINGGAYALNSRVVIANSYVTIEGSSYGAVEFDYGANGAISLEGSGSILGVIFRNIFFDGQGTTATNPAISSVNQSDAYRIELELYRCKIHGFRGNGVYMLNLKNPERLNFEWSVFDAEGRVTSWNGALINLYSSATSPGYYAGNWHFEKNFFNARFNLGCSINITASLAPMTNETHSIVSIDNQFYFDQSQYQTYKDVNYAYWLNTYGGNMLGFASDHDRTENTNFLNSTGLNDTSRGFISHGDFGMPSTGGVTTANSTYPFIWLGGYSWGWTIGDNDFSGGIAGVVCIKDSNIYPTRPSNIHDNYFRTTSGSPTWIIPTTGTNIHYNYGFITENAGSQATCINGTAIAHGLDGTPTSAVLQLRGNIAINSTCWYFDPTVYSINATHIVVSFYWNHAGTVEAVTAALNQTIYWTVVYTP